eukprot:scaffold35211_cov112-Isochrysis_galbana.AAC.5
MRAGPRVDELCSCPLDHRSLLYRRRPSCLNHRRHQSRRRQRKIRPTTVRAKNIQPRLAQLRRERISCELRRLGLGG